MTEEALGGANAAAKPLQKPRRSASAEMIIPGAGIVFTIYYFSTIWEAPWTAQVSSFFVGCILILCSVAVIVRLALAARRGTMTLDLETLIAPRNFIVKRLALLALTIGYIFVIRWLGFTLTTFIFLMLAMLVLNDGRHPKLTVALATVLALGGWLLFVVAFEVRFPAGLFETLMRGIL
jgi:hypothetical protein